MNERIKKVTTVVKEKWSGFSKAVKIMLISIPIVLIAIIILLALLLNHKDYVELYTGLNTTEAIQIGTAIENLGVTDVKVSGGTVTVPRDQQDYLRMQLALQGFPKDSTNYDIWNNGNNLWSTNYDKRETARQQREANIAATISQLDAIMACTANLSIPDTKEYTINPDNKPPSCSLTLRLKGDKELTNNEVRAIYDILVNAVEGMDYENISVVDTIGRSYDYITKEQEMAEGVDASGVPIARKRYEFQRNMQEALRHDLESMLQKIYGVNGYAFNVVARLNFDGKSVVSDEYFPVGPDSNTGVLEIKKWVNTNIGLNNAGGIVGATPNADLSPDYPTYIGDVDGENYYYQASSDQYDVTHVRTEIQKDGYEIETLSVGLAINTDNLTDRQIESTRDMVANAAGTDPANVSVMAIPFIIPNPNGSNNLPGGGISVITGGNDPYRNMLLWLVIALGVILVILLVASLFISKSRKKKIRRRQELALAAAQAAASENAAMHGYDSQGTTEVDFNIASLTEEAGKESRETILKREIAEFARTSPDIVASIIRNMLKEE